MASYGSRTPRSNHPPEADAVLLPGSNRLGRRAAQPPSRGGSCLRSRGIRPPELQEPLARLAGAVAVAAAIRAFVVPQISWVRCRRVARLTLALLAHKVGVRFY